MLKHICMKCQSLFSGKNKKNIINFSSVEFVHRMVNVELDSTKTNFAMLFSPRLDFFFQTSEKSNN